jgi:general secretion pathway protein N
VKRTIWLIVFGVLVFAGIVIARLPASWALPGPQSGMTCADADGTIWNGTCTGLTVHQQPVGDLSWDIHAMRLLSGKINADVVLTRPTGSVQGNVESGFDRKITAHDVVADLPIDQELTVGLPPNLRGMRGKLHAQIAYLRVDGQVIRAIEGLVEAHDLTDGPGANAQRWGSYSITFPPPTTGDPLGQLKDLGDGPFSLEGTLKLTPEPGFDLEGLVAARPSAPADLAKELQFLGSPDAQGRRPISLAATF